MKGKRSYSITWKIIRVIILCWLIPSALIIGMVAYYVLTNHYKNLSEGFEKQLGYGNELSIERLNAAIASSRKASEDKVLRDVSLEYLRGKREKYYAFTESKKYLNGQYRREDAFYHTIYWLKDDPRELNCGVYNLGGGGNYQQIQTYWQEDHEAIEEFSEDLDTAVGFLNQEGRLYMVRNIMSTDFRTVGVLVMRMNINYCFGNFLGIPMEAATTIDLNGQRFAVNGELLTKEAVGVEFTDMEQSVRKNGAIYVFQAVKTSDYQIKTIMQMDTSTVNMPFYGYTTIIIGMFLCLIPLFLIILRVFKRQVAEPVGDMIIGANEIEKGNMGYQLERKPANSEFEILFHSFNHMSEILESQFERIYKKEIALRDAQIMALQAHINPHFMNNTLEIINWEARLAGDMKVTKMIESLATLLDAAMDRKKRPEIFLSEEMNYIHAYLHITKARLGKRLAVSEDIPEDIVNCLVPRLILQPIVENAIEHGIIPGGAGEVTIKGWREEKFLVLEVTNDGTLTSEAEKDMKELLSQGGNGKEQDFSRIGIANVNQRLKILYGDEYGLEIKKQGNNKVVARLLIGFGQKEQKNTTNHRPSYSNLPVNE